MGTVSRCAIFPPELLPLHKLFPVLGMLFSQLALQISPGPSVLGSSITSFVKPSTKALLPAQSHPLKSSYLKSASQDQIQVHQKAALQ